MADKMNDTAVRCRHPAWLAVLPLLMTVLAACAISPQTVRIEPSITAAVSPIGRGRAVALTVVDRRGHSAFGSLGGVYGDTATIGPAGDVAAGVRKAVAEALVTEGFKVVAPGAAADLDMQIDIEDIRYQASGDPVVRKIALAARVGARLKRGDQEYSASSEVRESRDVLKVPDPGENETYVNATLSHALEKLLADADLIKFMR